jgi:PPM family protein phosphatase
MKRLALQVAQRTCTGARARNEDCIGVCNQGSCWCLVLSDGAGGHDEGARAAQLVVERVLAGFRSRPPVDGRDLSELLLDAHDAVVAGQRATPTREDASMHATVVVLVIDAAHGTALWGHVGDSRLYRWRAGELKSVTRDDSVLQWMLDTELVKAADVELIRNRGVLLSALGTQEDVQPHVSSEPLELERSDAFLLCSDGWWAGLEPQTISGLLASAATPDE